MDFVETEGDTIDAAIDNALKLLGVGRDKITVDIIAEGRKGILGFGSQKARVRAELRKSPLERIETKITAEPKPAETAEAPAIGVDHAALAAKGEAALREILHLMGIKATVTQTVSANGDETILEIRTEDSGLLIGRKGQTLEALQYLVTRIAGERLASEGPHIVIDVEKYRERRRRTLEDMALRLGEKAKRQRKAVTVDALSAALDACGATNEPFEVSLGRGGGTRGRSDAAWLEVLDGRDRIVALADRLDALLPPAVRGGLRPSRPAPHLTIARRASLGLIEAIREHGLGVPVRWTADRLVLFRSYTGTTAGSTYEPLAEARLAA